MPVLHYKDANIDKVLTESGPIVQFLLELYPSHLSPDLGSASDTAYFRYRMNWFVDTYFTKVNPYMFKMVGAVDKEEQVKKMEEMMLEVEKIEPLLKTDGGPYFGGRKEMTYVEVSAIVSMRVAETDLGKAMTIPFFMRLYDWSDDAIWPKEVAERLDKLPNLSKWAKHCMKQGSVTYVYPEGLRERVQERLPEAKKKYANV